MDRPQPGFWNIANLLSLSRLVLTPVICALIVYDQPLAAMVVLLVAAITDWLDGQAARRLGLLSPLGRQLDPLTDKIVVLCSYLYLLAVPAETGLMPWMVAVIVSREVIVQAIRGHIEGRGDSFAAKMAGKLKTTFQFASLIAILLVLDGRVDGPAVRWTRDALTWIAVGLTIYSGLCYVQLAWPTLRSESSGPTE
jgi:CDP-diacylglycerol--glycerol-3-phosphate 3-phosphatidyltransferase